MVSWRVTTTQRKVVVQAATQFDAVWIVAREGYEERFVKVERVAVSARPSYTPSGGRR